MAILRYLLSLLGILLALPLLVIIALALKLPITTSGIFYLIASLLVVIGLISAPLLGKHYFILIFAGIIGFFIIIGARLRTNPASEIKMLTLPDRKSTRLFGSVIDEQDGLIFGEEFFHLIGGDSAREHEGLVTAFQTAYSEMRTQGVFPSPVIDTYLNLQSPNAFDAIIIEPKGQPKFGVVFLHGYMGNVSAQCWEIAQAIKELGGVTVCPSTVWTGEWWKPGGLEILKNSLAYLREQGISKLYLGGFSNGGISIGYLAPNLANEKGLAGLFLIDGFTNGTEVAKLDLPVLMIEGTQDERIPAVYARQFADQVGEFGTYVEVDSDHFLIIKKPKEIQSAITIWLKYQFDQ